MERISTSVSNKAHWKTRSSDSFSSFEIHARKGTFLNTSIIEKYEPLCHVIQHIRVVYQVLDRHTQNNILISSIVCRILHAFEIGNYLFRLHYYNIRIFMYIYVYNYYV